MQENLTNKIEAILFYLAEPVRVDFLAKTLDISREDVLEAVKTLGETLSGRGIRVILHNDEVSIATAPELSGLIEKIVKEEREKDLGRSGIETLAIVAYKGPVSKKEIEYIRGVNSQYAVRSLLLRGLIEKKAGDGDERKNVYVVTGDTLRFLGLGHISELPEYKETIKQLEVIEEKEENDA